MTTRITVSLPDELVIQARQAVKDGHAESVSAYVADAIRRMPQERDHMAELLADMASDGVAPTEEHYRWAHEVLDIPWPG
jgi:Arc/MetJ-type ribon-helix-helix transcriptional regulator